VSDKREITLTVNGKRCTASAEPRRSLVDFLRYDLGLTGTHVGCEHGVCGACTILVNGQSVRSCLTFAVQADGADLTTIEGLSTGRDLHPIQQAFKDKHGLQCGFCTPAMILTTLELLRDNPEPSEDEIRVGLSGNLCMCTGYVNIIRAVKLAAERMRASAAA
jgi:carbon-monoxide dehydrogenase small subunit